MIMGKGMIANAFKDYQDDTNILVFAAGVSNSGETDEKSFEREFLLLKQSLKYDMCLIYFSSCDVIDNTYLLNNAYYRHKVFIEKYIERNSSCYWIFRLPQVYGPSDNKNTLINYFVEKIINEEKFDLFVNHYKSIISTSDVFQICDYVIKNGIKKNNVINVFNTNQMSALEIVSVIEEILHKKARFEINYEKRLLKYNDNIVNKIAKQLGIEFDNYYLYNILKNSL
jgi:nucleoside-diphosphate-sugar epimerase